MRDDVSIRSGSWQSARGTASTVGSGTVWQTLNDLVRLAVVVSFVLAFAWGIGAATRAIHPSRVTISTSTGDVMPLSVDAACHQQAVTYDALTVSCARRPGPR